MNSKEVQAHMHLYRQATESRAERDCSALARSSLYQYEKRERERKARQAIRLQIFTSWALLLAIACVTIPTLYR